MIRIDDEYVIDTDGLNYTLKRDLHKKNKKGEDAFRDIGYYRTLSSAILSAGEKKFKEAMQNGEYSLEDAIKVIQKIVKEVEEKIKSVDIKENNND